MSFELFLAALKPLADNGFNELEKYTEKEAFIIATLSPKCESIILKAALNQPYLNHAEYSIFHIDSTSDNISGITNFTDENILYPINLQIYDNNIIVNILSYETFGNYQLDNKNKYTFLPVNYSCENKKYGHRATIVIDNILGSVYLLEPNGKPTYFNSIISKKEFSNIHSSYSKTQFSDKIESFFENYFDKINEMFGLNYKYIKTNVWNPSNIILNNTSNVKLSNGDCMTISMILCQLINNLELKPQDLYKQFNELSDEESVCLIRSYSMGLIMYFKAIKINNHISQIDGLWNAYDIMKVTLPNIKSFIEFCKYVEENKNKMPSFINDILVMHN